MYYNITIGTNGGFVFHCTAHDDTLFLMRQARIAQGPFVWPFPDTFPVNQWPKGEIDLDWHDVVFLAAEPIRE